MTTTSTLVRTLLIYSICLPLAIFVGYIIAQPDPFRDYSTYIGLGLVLFILLLPLLLRWHRLLILACWNGCTVLYFVPGRPDIFLAFAWLSFIIAVAQFITNPKARFVSVPSVARPLIFIAVVTIVTAQLCGGIGLGAFGSETLNGKKYILLITAIVAYFALISQPIPPGRAPLYVALFFLSSITFAIGDLAPLFPQSLWFIFWLFPMSSESVSTILNTSGVAETIDRFGGVALATQGIALAMMGYYGLAELFNPRRLLRLAFFALMALLSLLGGFRSNLITLALAFALMFYLEGLFRSRLMPMFLLSFALVAVCLVGFSSHLPLNFQRTLTVIPGIKLDPLARESAETSSKWRLDMWRAVIPDVPRYLLLGKGYAVSAEDMRKQISGRPGDAQQFSAEGSALASDFHSGPLSLIIPFGIWGVIGFLWFIVASLKVLHRNYRYGPPHLHKLNTFLYVMFIVKTVFFFFVFGAFCSDLCVFTGILGLSIAINCGVAKPALALAAAPPQPLRFRPQAKRAVGTA
jgi:hypothetical protein